MTTSRHLKGTPVGGQFAPGTRAPATAEVTLSTDPSPQAPEHERQARSALLSAAAHLTGEGTVAAGETLALMSDADVARTRDGMLAVFRTARDAAHASRGGGDPRAVLASTLGPLLGTGTTGATEQMGAMSDDQVREVLDQLGHVWDQTAPQARPAPADPDPWAAVAAASAANPQSPTPLRSPQLEADLAAGDAFIHDGTVFQRRRPGVFPDTPYAIAVRTNRPIGDEELARMAGLAGYTYARTGGERVMGGPERVDERTFILHTDTTKGSAYERLDVFEENLAHTLEEGSPVRTTNRSGPGTAGTRLVDGIGEDLEPEIFYDDTYLATSD